MRLIVTTFVGIVFGFLIGLSFPTLSLTKLNLPSSLLPNIDLSYIEDKRSGISTQTALNALSSLKERLSPNIVVSESDFYLCRLWGNPNEDLTNTPPKFLVTFTVGFEQKHNIDAAVSWRLPLYIFPLRFFLFFLRGCLTKYLSQTVFGELNIWKYGNPLLYL